MIAYLQNNSCVDCGENDIRCLEFDHVHPPEKYKEVSVIVNKHTVDCLTKEIAKCDVRCRNCHKRRTDKQRADNQSEGV